MLSTGGEGGWWPIYRVVRIGGTLHGDDRTTATVGRVSVLGGKPASGLLEGERKSKDQFSG